MLTIEQENAYAYLKSGAKPETRADLIHYVIVALCELDKIRKHYDDAIARCEANAAKAAQG